LNSRYRSVFLFTCRHSRARLRDKLGSITFHYFYF